MIYLELDAKTEFSIFFFFFLGVGRGDYCVGFSFKWVRTQELFGVLRQGLIKSKLEVVCLLVDKLDS